LKIAGVVNSYNEALDIEDIVKVFVVERKILNLPTLKSSKNIKNVKKTNNLNFTSNNIHFPENSNKKNGHAKNNDGFRSIFSVRGLF
jgi:hypothetical protein